MLWNLEQQNKLGKHRLLTYRIMRLCLCCFKPSPWNLLREFPSLPSRGQPRWVDSWSTLRHVNEPSQDQQGPLANHSPCLNSTQLYALMFRDCLLCNIVVARDISYVGQGTAGWMLYFFNEMLFKNGEKNLFNYEVKLGRFLHILLRKKWGKWKLLELHFYKLFLKECVA